MGPYQLEVGWNNSTSRGYNPSCPFIRSFIGVITPFITGRRPPCIAVGLHSGVAPTATNHKNQPIPAFCCLQQLRFFESPSGTNIYFRNPQKRTGKKPTSSFQKSVEKTHLYHEPNFGGVSRATNVETPSKSTWTRCQWTEPKAFNLGRRAISTPETNGCESMNANACTNLSAGYIYIYIPVKCNILL